MPCSTSTACEKAPQIQDRIGAGHKEDAERPEPGDQHADESPEARTTVHQLTSPGAGLVGAPDRETRGHNRHCQQRQCAKLTGDGQADTNAGQERPAQTAVQGHIDATQHGQHRKRCAGGIHGKKVTQLNRLCCKRIERSGQQPTTPAENTGAEQIEQQDRERIKQGDDEASGDCDRIASAVCPLHQRDGRVRKSDSRVPQEKPNAAHARRPHQDRGAGDRR